MTYREAILKRIEGIREYGGHDSHALDDIEKFIRVIKDLDEEIPK